MGYPEAVSYNSTILRAGTITTAVSLTVAAAQWVGFAVLSPIQVTRVKFIVTTAITAGNTGPIVAVIRRPTLGSTGGAVTIGTMTLPSSCAAAQVFYKDFTYGSGSSNKYINAGEELSLEVVTNITGASAAGAGFMVVEHENVTDQAANQTLMVAGT